MPEEVLPGNLRALHIQEEFLRDRALEVVAADERLLLHLVVVERAMELADQLRQVKTDDEDLTVVQLFTMRMFTAFGASLKLALSGYGQNSALVMRDILETVFLLDLFCGDRNRIRLWRLEKEKDCRRVFSPVEVRKALDKRDGFRGRKRAAMYQMFSELAVHPSTKSHHMMRPRPDWDAVSGPFLEAGALEAVIPEMGRIATQVGDIVVRFLPEDRGGTLIARAAYMRDRAVWIATFYPASDSR